MSIITEKDLPINIEELHIQAKGLFKLYMRLKRHGDITTVNLPGRKKKTDSHKKRVRILYKQKLKDIKIQDGTNKPVGRPKKIVLVS